MCIRDSLAPSLPDAVLTGLCTTFCSTNGVYGAGCPGTDFGYAPTYKSTHEGYAATRRRPRQYGLTQSWKRGREGGGGKCRQ
eukprot:1139681-Rhodomonas_salina.1